MIMATKCEIQRLKLSMPIFKNTAYETVVALVISELDSVSFLIEDIRSALKVFLLWKRCMNTSPVWLLTRV